jgi:hypothetical protein
MTFVPALVVVCAQFLMHLVVWVGTALLVQVLGMLAMDATGLEVLVFVLSGTLPVVAFVITATAIVVELTMLASAMLTTMVTAVALIVQPVAPMLVGEKAFLMRILFLQLAA